MVIVPRQEGATRGKNAAASGPLILVIAAQHLFVAALSRLLSASALRARTSTAEGYEGALELLRVSPVDLVLCDVRIHTAPCQDFLTSVARLAQPPPVILLGDMRDEALLLRAIAGPAAGLFTKDAEPDEFLAGVQAVLAGHRAVGQNIMELFMGRLATLEPLGVPLELAQLSKTEVDILAMLGAANSVIDIATARGISKKTVRNHLANIYRKLGLSSRTQAMLTAARMGLVVE